MKGSFLKKVKRNIIKPAAGLCAISLKQKSPAQLSQLDIKKATAKSWDKRKRAGIARTGGVVPSSQRRDNTRDWCDIVVGLCYGSALL